jgi:hypothetical protein
MVAVEIAAGNSTIFIVAEHHKYPLARHNTCFLWLYVYIIYRGDWLERFV